MISEAFKLVGTVEARTRGAENDLRRVDRVAQQTARSFQSAFGSGNTINIDRAFFNAGKAADGFLSRFSHISQIIQGIPQIGQLAGALTHPLFQAAEEGIRLNMVLEQAQIGYEQVAGSAEKASKFLDDLWRFGKSSPFRFEGLLQASRLMTTFGFSLDEQIPKLTIWGNAIASSGEISADKIHDVVTAFGQMRMAGRVNGQDMMQLTNANIPGWEMLAKAIGKTVAETRKLSEAGRLDGRKAVEAITAMMAIDPRYKGMMDRLQNTTAGRMSAAQDIIQGAEARATKGLTQNINATLGEALKKEDLVNSLAGSFDAVLGPVSGVLSAAAKDLLGGGITGGIKEGIAAGREAVSLEAASLGQGIIDSFKAILGINSPSKVFIEFGHDVADGFNIGFAEGMQSSPFGSVIDKFLSSVKDKTEREKIQRLISENAARTGIPEDVLRALVHQESGGNRNALSPKGARGVMQLMPDTARDQGLRVDKRLDERLDVEKSIRAGADYLKQQLDRFHGDLKLALAAYNAGPAAVTKYGNQVPPYTETQSYVRSILSQVSASTASPAPRTVSKTLQEQAEEFRRVFSELTAEERKQLEQGSGQIRDTMTRLADVGAQLRGAQKALEEARPAANGGRFDPDREYAAAFKVGDLLDQQKRLLDALRDLQLANQKLVTAFMARYGDGPKLGADVGGEAFRNGPHVGADVGGEIFRLLAQASRSTTKAAEPASTRPRIVGTAEWAAAQAKIAVEKSNAALSKASAQIATNTERTVKGAGEWKDVITESEEAVARLKVQWNGIAQSFENAFLSATSQAIQGHFGDAIKGFFLDLGLDIAQQVEAAMAARLSKSLFDFQGSDSNATGGLVSKLLNKIGAGSLLERLGLQAPRQMTAADLLDKMHRQPLSTDSSVTAASLSSASGEAVKQEVRKAADRITDGQKTQTAEINKQIQDTGERIIQGLTPAQQGFWKGLLSSALSAAAGAAAGKAIGGAFNGGGGADEGPAQPRPTSPPEMKFPNGRTTPRALGGDLIAGHAYLFGERGPEVGVFPANGTMLPNNHPATQMALNGGHVPPMVHQTVNIYAQDIRAASSRETMTQAKRRLAKLQRGS